MNATENRIAPETAQRSDESATNRAARYTRYGGPEVMELATLPMPTPGPNEVLIRIRATTVTATETTFRRGQFLTRLFTGLRRPKQTVLGEELAGDVVAVGSAVRSLEVGAAVFGTAGPNFGANAQFICLPEEGVLASKPKNLNYAEAAASVDGALTALPFLRDTGGLRRGQSVLVYGASGSVGTAAVQLARHLGAEVTAVTSTRNLALVKALGAQSVIDYTKEDFTETEERYDIVFDTVGKIKFGPAKSVLKERGVFLQAGFGLGILLLVIWSTLFGRKKLKIAATGLRPPAERKQDLEYIGRLLETGELKPVLDRSFPLEEIVAAHGYVDTGRKRGNVAVLLE